MRKNLHAVGYRYTLHVQTLPGKPDIVFSKRRLVIFVNGCFWHMHDCPNGRAAPKTNAEFWSSKRAATVERDDRQQVALESLGWRAMTVWECELSDLPRVMRKLQQVLGRVTT